MSPADSRPHAPLKRTSPVARHAIVLLVFLFALGFPGRLADLAGGSRLSMLMQYAVFALQIVFMLITSGDDLMEMKVIDLKREYTPMYLLLGVFFVLSMLVTHDHGAQFISCLRFSVTGLFALWVVNWYDVKHILLFTVRAQAIIVALCLVFMFLPGSGWATVDGARCFVGIFPGKNVCGAQLAFGLTMQVALMRLYWAEGRQPGVLFYAMLLCQLVMLLLTRAMGSLISAGLPIAALLLMHEKRGVLRRIPLGWMYVLGSVGFLIFALNLMPLLEPLLTALGKDATLTGRIPMWQEHISNMLTSHTFTGYGFGMFWENTEAVAVFHAAFDENSWAGTMTTGAHNELIELWLDVGLIGMGVYFVMLILAFRRVWEAPTETYLFCLAVLLGVFIKGLTERTHSTASYWTLYLFLACALALKARATPPPAAIR
ncbi:MAG: O-antigen ligase family protein [Clostridia bacterium]|nr:O-antigen ligase family protein [Clostridia bacterium]